MKSTMFIPKKLKVGFQNRSDTFTGKLSYVIYYDEKNKLRKEKSWTSWCDQKIPPMDLDNVPTSGFVFNKGVTRFSDWGSGRSMIRIHDPRGFEFEITLDNLIGILMYSDVSKRDIVEQCVFAWYGTELVLLPVNSVEYQESIAYTDKQSKKVSARDLVPGRQYQQKKHDTVLTYIGYYEWYDTKSNYDYASTDYRYGYGYHRHSIYTKTQTLKGKKHVFWNGKSFDTPSPSTLSNEVSDDVVPNYADLVDAFFKTTNSQLIVGVEMKEITDELNEELNYYNHKMYMNGPEANTFYVCNIPVSDLISYSYITDISRLNAALNITGDHHAITATPDSFIVVSDSRKDVPVAKPFDLTGESPELIGPNDFTVTGEQRYNSKMSVSDAFVKKLNSMGFGIMFYKLKNGNLAKIN